LTVPFVRYAIKLIEEHSQNNMMHNTLKNILVKGIMGKTHTAHAICSKLAGLLKFIIDTAVRETKSGSCYMNQLHHISAAVESVRQKNSELAQKIANESISIINLDPAWENYIKGIYVETIKAHTRLLGG
jgi:ribosomal protein L1